MERPGDVLQYVDNGEQKLALVLEFLNSRSWLIGFAG
jgi:hypothetical protein